MLLLPFLGTPVSQILHVPPNPSPQAPTKGVTSEHRTCPDRSLVLLSRLSPACQGPLGGSFSVLNIGFLGCSRIQERGRDSTLGEAAALPCEGLSVLCKALRKGWALGEGACPLVTALGQLGVVSACVCHTEVWKPREKPQPRHPLFRTATFGGGMFSFR